MAPAKNIVVTRETAGVILGPRCRRVTVVTQYPRAVGAGDLEPTTEAKALRP